MPEARAPGRGSIVGLAAQRLKNVVRLVEAATASRVTHVQFRGHDVALVRSRWWDDTDPSLFDAEILPYFRGLASGRSYRTIVDAGAATGQFAIAAALAFPGAHVHAFEPSRRQRLLFLRNVRRNRLDDRVSVVGAGLWDWEGKLAFRTHGALGTFAAVGTLPSTLSFAERVATIPLDTWVSRARVPAIDLIKMDIEGAELEALRGARQTIAAHRPDVLIQAYHVRDGSRTFERCADVLGASGYRVSEVRDAPGLLFGRPATDR